MPCYHPLKIKKIGVNLETGKDKYSISKYNEGDDLTGFTLVPCGSCIGCRIDYSRQWADRCMLELQDHEESYFLTLTYDPDHEESITNYYTDRDTGEAYKILSLNKRDFQLWHKSLRKELDNRNLPKIRFFGCGEYGSPENTMRPHFHEIVFGLHLDDLKLYKYNRLRQPLYTSEFLNRIWKKGFVIVGQVNWQTCAYVARYVTKKLKGKAADLYKDYNLTPPFTIMSRKPGIARNYYENHPELFDYKYINIALPDGGRKIYPSKYFKHLLEVDDPERYEELRNINKLSAELKNDAKMSMTDLNLAEMYEVDEATFSNRIKTLIRKES